MHSLGLIANAQENIE